MVYKGRFILGPILCSAHLELSPCGPSLDLNFSEKITIHIKDASYKPSWKKDNDEWIEIVIKPK